MRRRMTDYVWGNRDIFDVDDFKVYLILRQRGGGGDLLELDLPLGGFATECHLHQAQQANLARE